MILFRRGKTKVRLITEERISMPQNTTPLYAEGMHMLDGLAEEKVVEAITEEVLTQAEPYPTTIVELHHARNAFERELTICQRVKASTLKSLDLGSDGNPRTPKISNNLLPDERSALIRLLTEYQDVFAWSYTDMKGLDPQYYQHQIHLQYDARPVQQ